MIKIVDEALERRNYLTPHFFRSHNFALYSEEGRKMMTAELKEIQAQLNVAHRMLDGGGCNASDRRPKDGFRTNRPAGHARKEAGHLSHLGTREIAGAQG